MHREDDPRRWARSTEERHQLREVADPDRVRLLATQGERDLEGVARVVQIRRERRAPRRKERAKAVEQALGAVVAATVDEVVLDAVQPGLAGVRPRRGRGPDHRLVIAGQALRDRLRPHRHRFGRRERDGPRLGDERELHA